MPHFTQERQTQDNETHLDDDSALELLKSGQVVSVGGAHPQSVAEHFAEDLRHLLLLLQFGHVVLDRAHHLEQNNAKEYGGCFAG